MTVAKVTIRQEAVKHWLVYGYRGLEDKKANTTRKPLLLLTEKLGTNATRVWCALLGLRASATGIAHPTTAGLARKLGIGARTVTRALRRLAEAGLVYSRGKIWLDKLRMRVWCRWVWGEVGGTWVRVPKKCAQWMEKEDAPTSWGGRREGAGRKHMARKTAKTKAQKSSGAPIEEDSKESSYSLSENTSTSPARARGRQSFFANAAGCVRLGGGGQDFAPGLRSRVDWWRDLLRREVIPNPRFGWQGAEVPHVFIPLPEKLSPDRDLADSAWALAVAYRSYVTRKTGKRSHLFARGKFENSKHFALLRDWAEMMLSEVDPDSQIAPAVWIAFMDRRWSHGRGKSKKAAPITWVFKLDELRKPTNRAWCRKEATEVWGVMAGRSVWCKEATDLRERFGRMKRAVYRAPQWYPDEIVQRLWDKFFPDDLYPALVQSSRVGQQRLLDRLARRVESGDLSVYGGSF